MDFEFLLGTLCGMQLIFILFLLYANSKQRKSAYENAKRWKEMVDKVDEEWEERMDDVLSDLSSTQSKYYDAKEAYDKELESSRAVLQEAARYEEKFLELTKKYGSAVIENENLIKEVIRWKENAGKELSTRKSSEVRLGKTAEKFAALMEDFPYPLEDAVFSGQPIDYICYSEDGIHFVEVKSGTAALSSKQRKIKELVDSGKVSFEVFRIEG